MAANEVPQIFAGVKFWISRNVPQRQYIVGLAREHGAEIVVLEAHAHHMLADPMRKPHPPGAISFDIIQSSLRDGRLQDPNRHRLSVPTRADRPVSSVTVASRGGRAKFTEEEDQFLYDWVTRYREAGGKWKGNEIYKQLEHQRPQHTFQSWRDRYIKYVSMQQRTLTPNFSVPVETPQDELESVRSPKRRRIERSPDPVVVAKPSNAPSTRAHPELTPVGPEVTIQAQTSTAPRQSDEAKETLRTFYEKTRDKHEFSYEDMKSMFGAVPTILNCVERSGKGFADLAEARGHTVEAWQSLYEDIVLPEFRRRHDLLDKAKFRDYVAALIVAGEEHDKADALAATDAQATVTSSTGHKSKQPKKPPSSSAPNISVKLNRSRDEAGNNHGQSQSQSTVTASGSQGSQPLPVTGQTLDHAAMPSHDTMSLAAETVSSHTKGPASKEANDTQASDSQKSNKRLLAANVPIIASGSNSTQSQDVPESGQRPVKRLTPTTPSRRRDDADDSQNTQRSSILPLRSSVPDQTQSEGEQYLSIDLTQDNPEPDAASDHAFSDTGSEYHPFDTAPERSQFWAESPVEGRSPTKSSGGESDGTNAEGEEDEGDVLPPPRLKRYRSPRPGQSRAQKAASETGDDDIKEDEAENTVQERSKAVSSRLETQALFDNSLTDQAEDEFAFDLPEPAEGWEELGVDPNEVEASALIEMQNVLSDRVLQSTERSDADATPGLMAKVGGCDAEDAAHALVDQDAALTMSSGQTEEESEESEGEEIVDRRKSSTIAQRLPRIERSASHGSGGTDGESATNSTTSSNDATTPTFNDLLRRARQGNGRLSDAVIHRLVSAAVQACTLDYQVAKSAVGQMVKSLQGRQRRAMSVDEANELIAENIRGCWTLEDDQDLLSGSKLQGRERGAVERIRRVERKHGVVETGERISFLEHKYGAAAKTK